ncbi:hypothetical protein D0861_08148 [Hortaea werneckii]|uniref:Heterokaryon incompatibility domain-containing protein n=1 Tax=Hortaea werneckii TaxID=91943 RepID=A0A3M7EZ07_HORWE|nr:hypothetical protein D0861_08148 [Hortaea werneckii]
MTDATATYQPLDTSKHDSRLVRASTDENGEISILLDVFSLDSPPEYVALSYCWTAHPPTIQITLNELPFWIRPNLHDFLHRFSGEGKTKWIYIDALCINQANVTERSSQVNIMGRIYQGARKVIAWLGGHLPDDRGGSVGFAQGASLSGQDLLTLTRQPPQAGHRRKTVPVYSKFLSTFASHTYWNRLWIIQELVLAQDFLIWCGRLHLTSYQLSVLVLIVEDVFSKSKESCPDPWPDSYWQLSSAVRDREAPRQIMAIASILHWRRGSGMHAYDMFSAINSTAILDCSLVHDHIFGIVGLTSSVIVADYSIPVLELYLRALSETLVDLMSSGPLLPKASTLDFLLPLYIFWENLLLSVGFSPLDTVVALTTTAVGLNLWILPLERNSLEGVAELNAVEEALWTFCHDYQSNLKYLGRNPPLMTKAFVRLRDHVKIRLVIGRLERKVKRDANLSEAGEGGRTMPCSAWIELSKTIAREVVEAKNRQLAKEVAKRNEHLEKRQAI